MGRRLRYYILLITSASVFAKDPELPLCPANFQFLPQQLPMHCRLPSVPHPQPPVPFPPYYPGSNPGRPENTPPVPVPPIPGFPSGASPGFLPGGPSGFPPGMPPGMPMAMPMPMPGAPPSAKLPVIVMPFYSPDPAYKQGSAPNLRPRPYKRRVRIRRDSSSTETDTDTDSSDTDSSDSDKGWWRKRRGGRRAMGKHKRRRHNKNRENFLTPVLQYVTKEGYVIYEKKISNGEAKGWLGTSAQPKKEEEVNALEIPDMEKGKSEEEDAEVVTTSTRAPKETPKVKVKIQKNTNIKRHHHHKPNRLIEQPITMQDEVNS